MVFGVENICQYYFVGSLAVGFVLFICGAVYSVKHKQRIFKHCITEGNRDDYSLSVAIAESLTAYCVSGFGVLFALDVLGLIFIAMLACGVLMLVAPVFIVIFLICCVGR